MKLFANIVIFESQQEINHMDFHIKIGKVRIYPRRKADFTESFKNYGEHFISMSVEIFECLFAFIGLLFCWVPFIGIDCVKKENSND